MQKVCQPCLLGRLSLCHKPDIQHTKNLHLNCAQQGRLCTNSVHGCDELV
jgi:hypothetical protein